MKAMSLVSSLVSLRSFQSVRARLAKIESKTRKATLCPPTSPRVQACDLGIELGVLSLLSLYPTGFRKQEVLLAQGEGASARLFRGSLPSGLAVAVKRVNRSSEIEYSRRNPFTTEFATVVGHLRHKNLVQLRRVML
uniref:Protein kinase domain-containing protein n=1 Tax=Salix viminalis TaxID=40686 RepID=A0A6N2N4H7_SALVM